MLKKIPYQTNLLFRITTLLILAFSFSWLDLSAQTSQKDSTRYALEAKYHYGIVIPHHTNMTYIINDYAQGVEFSFIRRRFQSGVWERNFNGPETGLGFWYSSFGRKEIYGEGMALFSFINFRLFDWGPLSAKYSIAPGIGYANKPFKVGENTYNTVFGSHVNAYLGLGLMVHYQVAKGLRASSSFSIKHMSNGSSRKPNNGINTATLTVGLIYDLDPHSLEPEIEKQKTSPSSARELLGTISATRNQPAAYNPTRYWSGSLTLTHLWYRKRTKAYGAGLDLIHFGGAPYALKNFEEIDPFSRYGFADYFYAGLFGTMESHLGTTALYMSAGAYIYQKTKPRQPFYARLGIRQKIAGNLLAHVGIKANFFTAEFVEFGIGYRWKYRN